MQPIIVRAGIAVIAILSWSGPLAAAGPAGQRLAVLAGPPVPQSPASAADIAAIDAPLTFADRQIVEGARTRTYDMAALEPFDLTVRMSRFRGGRPDATHFAPGSDRFTGQAGSLTVNLPITSGLTLQPDFSLTRIRRHLVTVADIFRPRTTFETSVGVGLASTTGPTVRLDWVRSAPQGTRAPFERMAELMGGAPPAARGLRLSLLGHDTGPFQWTFGLASLQRARSDSAFAVAPGYVPEKRAEISLRFAF